MTLPRCRRCGRVSVFDPCRSCATPEEAKDYPPLPPDRDDLIEARRAEGRRLRDQGVARSDENAPTDWKPVADRAIREAAHRHATLIVDDVWVVLDEWGIPRPPEGRAMGARMQAAVKAKVLRPTEDFKPSFDPAHHATPRRQYVSLVYLDKSDTLW